MNFRKFKKKKFFRNNERYTYHIPFYREFNADSRNILKF